MKIGQKVKQIRLAKGIKIKDLVKNIVSVQQFSKFENGKSELTISKFLKIIDRLNMSYGELRCLCEEFYTFDNQDCFIEKSDEAVKNGNLNKVNELFLEEAETFKLDGNIRHKHNIMLLKLAQNRILHEPVDKRIVSELIDYLWTVEDIGNYEIKLLSLAIIFFSNEQKFFLIKRVYHDGKIPVENKDIILKMLFNAVIGELESENLLYCGKYLDILHNEIQSSQYYERTKLNYFEGLYFYRIARKKRGERMVKKALKVIEFLDEYWIYKVYRNYFEAFKEKQDLNYMRK